MRNSSPDRSCISYIFVGPDVPPVVVACEDPGVGFDSDRATFDCTDEVSTVAPPEEVARADLVPADVVEEDRFFPAVAVPPDGAFAWPDRLVG